MVSPFFILSALSARVLGLLARASGRDYSPLLRLPNM